MTNQELEQLRKALAAAVIPLFIPLERRVASIEGQVTRIVPRRNLTETTKAKHRDVLAYLGGRCPCCGEVYVVDDKGGLVGAAQYDHFYSRERRGFRDTWLICQDCHRDLTAGHRAERAMEYQSYQRKAARFERHRQGSLALIVRNPTNPPAQPRPG